MPTAPDSARVYAVVLAAGAATRFGASKQLAIYQGEPLARRAVQLASTACGSRTVLVLGHNWQPVYGACKPVSGAMVFNADYDGGIGTSIAAGVAAIRHAADAIIIILADQPLITAAHLQALQASWSGQDREIVASAYAGAAGVPALFPAACFDHLCSLDGDRGAQSLLGDPRYSLRTIEFDDAALDIDTPADLLKTANNARS